MWMSHVSHVNYSCLARECPRLDKWMSLVSHMDGSNNSQMTYINKLNLIHKQVISIIRMSQVSRVNEPRECATSHIRMSHISRVNVNMQQCEKLGARCRQWRRWVSGRKPVWFVGDRSLRDSFLRETWLNHLWDMTRLYVRHDSLFREWVCARVTGLVVTQSHAWHGAFVFEK